MVCVRPLHFSLSRSTIRQQRQQTSTAARTHRLGPTSCLPCVMTTFIHLDASFSFNYPFRRRGRRGPRGRAQSAGRAGCQAHDSLHPFCPLSDPSAFSGVLLALPRWLCPSVSSP